MSNHLKSFTKPNLRQLRLEIDAALAPIAKNYGIALSLGRIKFFERSFAGKLEGAILASEAVNENGHNPLTVRDIYLTENVKLNGRHYGVAVADIGKRVTIDGAYTWTFVGLNCRAPKMPYIYENMNGRRVKSSRNYVDLTFKRMW